MSNRKLIITYIPDVLSMIPHNGSTTEIKTPDGHGGYYERRMDDNYLGKIGRAERESFDNIKSIKAATKIVRKRNSVVVATYNGEAINIVPLTKEEIASRKEGRKAKRKTKTD